MTEAATTTTRIPSIRQRRQVDAQCSFNVALLLFRTGRNADALVQARESLAESHHLGDARTTIYGLLLVADLLLRERDDDVAARLLGAAHAEQTRLGLALETLEQNLDDDAVAKLG